jgi:hypothetical protein
LQLKNIKVLLGLKTLKVTKALIEADPVLSGRHRGGSELMILDQFEEIFNQINSARCAAFKCCQTWSSRSSANKKFDMLPINGITF